VKPAITKTQNKVILNLDTLFLSVLLIFNEKISNKHTIYLLS